MPGPAICQRQRTHEGAGVGRGAGDDPHELGGDAGTPPDWLKAHGALARALPFACQGPERPRRRLERRRGAPTAGANKPPCDAKTDDAGDVARWHRIGADGRRRDRGFENSQLVSRAQVPGPSGPQHRCAGRCFAVRDGYRVAQVCELERCIATSGHRGAAHRERPVSQFCGALHYGKRRVQHFTGN